MSDPYTVLGVDRNADDETIKAAFRKLALKHHPDKNLDDPTAETRFKEINTAFQAIDTAEKRHALERGGNREFRFENFDFEGEFGAHFEEILKSFHAQTRQRNRNYNTVCRISLYDAFNGCDISVSTNEGNFLKVKVPAGVDNGVKLRIPEAGEKVHSNSPPGDLFVSIEIDDHPVFKRNGRNIISEITIDAIDAMTGLEIVVPTIDGEILNIDIEAGIQFGHQIRIDSKGMPSIMNAARGDHIVIVKIEIPSLTDDQKALLKTVRPLEILEDSPT